MTQDTAKKIGQFFLESGAIDEFQLKSALGYQRRWGKKLGQCLVELGFISESKLARALSKIHRLPTIDLDRTLIQTETVHLLSRKLATKHNVMPVLLQKSGNKKKLFLATADPSDIRAIDEISFVSGFSLSLLIATYSGVERAIRRYYMGESINLSQGAIEPQLVTSEKAKAGKAGHQEFDEASIRITPLAEERTVEKAPAAGPAAAAEKPLGDLSKPRQRLKNKSRYVTSAFRIEEADRAPTAEPPETESTWEPKTKVGPEEVLPARDEPAAAEGKRHPTPHDDLMEGLENDGVTGIFRDKVDREVFQVIQNTIVDVPASAAPAAATSPQARILLDRLLELLRGKGLLNDQEKNRLATAADRTPPQNLPQVLHRLLAKLTQKKLIDDRELEKFQLPPESR